MNNKDYMTIDSVENAVDSLESILSFLERTNNIKWKWILFSLYHSLYMFCVINLTGSNYKQVLRNYNNEDNRIQVRKGNDSWKISKRVKRESGKGYTIEWVTLNTQPETLNPQQVNEQNPNIIENNKDEFLISIYTALARVQDGYIWMSRDPISKPLVLTNEECDSIDQLVYFRDKFQHFIPVMWSYEIDIFKKICLDVLRVIEFLALETNQIDYYEDYENLDGENDDFEMKDNVQKLRIKEALNKIRTKLI